MYLYSNQNNEFRIIVCYRLYLAKGYEVVVCDGAVCVCSRALCVGDRGGKAVHWFLTRDMSSVH